MSSDTTIHGTSTAWKALKDEVRRALHKEEFSALVRLVKFMESPTEDLRGWEPNTIGFPWKLVHLIFPEDKHKHDNSCGKITMLSLDRIYIYIYQSSKWWFFYCHGGFRGCHLESFQETAFLERNVIFFQHLQSSWRVPCEMFRWWLSCTCFLTGPFQNLYYFDMLFASYRIYHKFMCALVFLNTVVVLEIVFIFGLCLVL